MGSKSTAASTIVDGKESACNVGDPVRALGQEIPWRMQWEPTPVSLPREFHGWRSLQFMGLQRVRHVSTHTYLLTLGIDRA